LDTDIKGAIDYQMQAVWIRDPQTQNPGIIIPNYEISEILKIINKLNLKRFNP